MTQNLEKSLELALKLARREIRLKYVRDVLHGPFETDLRLVEESTHDVNTDPVAKTYLDQARYIADVEHRRNLMIDQSTLGRLRDELGNWVGQLSDQVYPDIPPEKRPQLSLQLNYDQLHKIFWDRVKSNDTFRAIECLSAMADIAVYDVKEMDLPSRKQFQIPAPPESKEIH
jgi:hypothetical protein